MPFENELAMGINFALEYHGETGLFKTKIKAADASEE